MKNKKAISLLFLSNIISGFAQGISMIAIPWYFVEVVGRPEVLLPHISSSLLPLYFGVCMPELLLIDTHEKGFLF